MKDANTTLSARARRMPWVKIAAVAAAVVAVSTAATFAARGLSRVPTVQPVRFNHGLHARLNSSCDVCHTGCEKGQAAGYPGGSICKECHDPAGEPAGKTAEEQVLRDILAKGNGVAWKRLDVLPVDVRFSHALHVGKSKLECARCHGAIGLSEAPPEAPLRDFKMNDCIACHQEHGAKIGCVNCHR